MIIEAKPIDHLVFGLTTAGEAHSMEPFDLHGAKERFGHCVVQQLPLRLIEPRMPKAESCFWKSPLAYWLPRSE